MRTRMLLQRKQEQTSGFGSKNKHSRVDLKKSKSPKANVRTADPKEMIGIFLADPYSVTHEEFSFLQSIIGYRQAINLLEEGKQSKKLEKAGLIYTGVKGSLIKREQDPTVNTKPAVVQKKDSVSQERQKDILQTKKDSKGISFNTGLPANLKDGLEKLSGFDLSDISVHTKSDKPEQVGALAYTQGKDIYIAPGQEKHLAHEGWHAVQQKQGRVSPTLKMKTGTLVNDDAELEKEADSMGSKAVVQGSMEADNTGGKSFNTSGQSSQYRENVIQRSTKKYNNYVITSLSDKDFLEIYDKKTKIKYYGGDQEWYGKYTQSFGGCGPTAAANILAYMAMTNPKLKGLYEYNTINKKDFSAFMEDVYKYVTPFEVPVISSISDKKNDDVLNIPSSLGISNIKDFANGVEKFAKSKGINLKAKWPENKLTFKNATTYIRGALEKDCPVALLNVFNPINIDWKNPKTKTFKKYIYEQHWVVVTGITENKRKGDVTLKVSSWGGEGTISLNSLYDSIRDNQGVKEKLFPSGIIYFEYKPVKPGPTPCPAPTPPLVK